MRDTVTEAITASGHVTVDDGHTEATGAKARAIY